VSRTTRIKRSALDTLARIFETLEGRIQAQWLPKLVDLTPTPTGAHAHIVEYGCGHYGCVFPTLDPNVVLKVTEDDTEAEFAAHLSTTIAVPICTTYYDVIEVPRDQVKHPTFLLWREAASHVGGIEEMVDDPDEALRLIRQQHVAAQHAFDLIHRATERGTDPDDLAAVVEVWVDTCVEMATQTAVPELAPLGAGLVEVYRKNRVFFGDIHAGNIGLVTRDGVDQWVITDPGHVAVLPPPTHSAYSDPELTEFLRAYLAPVTGWTTTDRLLYVTGDTVTREQMVRVLSAMHDAGELNYKRDKGWRVAR